MNEDDDAGLLALHAAVLNGLIPLLGKNKSETGRMVYDSAVSWSNSIYKPLS